LGVDLDDGVRVAGADRLDAITTPCDVNLAGDLSAMKDQVATVARFAADRAAGEHDHDVRTRHRPEQAGDRFAVRKRDLQATCRIAARPQIARGVERKRKARDRAYAFGPHTLDVLAGALNRRGRGKA